VVSPLSPPPYTGGINVERGARKGNVPPFLI